MSAEILGYILLLTSSIFFLMVLMEVESSTASFFFRCKVAAERKNVYVKKNGVGMDRFAFIVKKHFVNFKASLLLEILKCFCLSRGCGWPGHMTANFRRG